MTPIIDCRQDIRKLFTSNFSSNSATRKQESEQKIVLIRQAKNMNSSRLTIAIGHAILRRKGMTITRNLKTVAQSKSAGMETMRTLKRFEKKIQTLCTHSLSDYGRYQTFRKATKLPQVRKKGFRPLRTLIQSTFISHPEKCVEQSFDFLKTFDWSSHVA